jgi:transposase-like protein
MNPAPLTGRPYELALAPDAAFEFGRAPLEEGIMEALRNGDSWEWEHFRDEPSAYRFVESRLWPTGPVCPRCHTSSRSKPLCGASTRIGLYKCYQCDKPFTVKSGTIFEGSHVPLHLWLRAIFLIKLGQRPISPFKLHRILGLTPKTVMFMVHRIRTAASMRRPSAERAENSHHGRPVSP